MHVLLVLLVYLVLTHGIHPLLLLNNCDQNLILTSLSVPYQVIKIIMINAKMEPQMLRNLANSYQYLRDTSTLLGIHDGIAMHCLLTSYSFSSWDHHVTFPFPYFPLWFSSLLLGPVCARCQLCNRK